MGQYLPRRQAAFPTRISTARLGLALAALMLLGSVAGCTSSDFTGSSARRAADALPNNGADGPGNRNDNSVDGGNAGQECKNYTTESSCNLDPNCNWSGSKNQCDISPGAAGGAGMECPGYNAKPVCVADTNCEWLNNKCTINPGAIGGTAGQCALHTSQSACNADQSCEWDNTVNLCTVNPAGIGGGGGNDGSLGGLDAASATNPDIAVDSGTVKPPNIRIGMLVNDLNCTFCHLEIHGDVGSVTTVPPFRHDSHGQVFGRWFVNGSFNAANNLDHPPKDDGIVVGTTLTNYDNAGHELPVDSNGNPTFPTINFGALPSMMTGIVKCSAAGCTQPQINGVYNGNLTLVGTPSQPIQLRQDILVQGDLVMTGSYTGVGTIYVAGNVYIPANLTASNKASFPYPDPVNGDYSAADRRAQQDMQAGKDGLGLASQNNIFIADLENYMDASNGAAGTGLNGARQYNSLYDWTDARAGSTGGGAGPLLSPRSAIGIENVYTWFPEAQFQNLYQSVTPCWTNSNRQLVSGHQWGERAVNEIDAFLYAGKAIGGVSRATNWTINGGMIAQAMHIISGAGFDSVGAPSCSPSTINFDYRMRNQLPLLGALAPFFPSQ